MLVYFTIVLVQNMLLFLYTHLCDRIGTVYKILIWLDYKYEQLHKKEAFVTEGGTTNNIKFYKTHNAFVHTHTHIHTFRYKSLNI